MTTKRIKNQLKATIKNSLSKARTDLEIMLDRVDLLNSEQVNNKLHIYEKTLHNIQNDFIAQISAHVEVLPESADAKSHLEKHSSSAEITGGVLAGGGSAFAGGLITISQTSGWWVFSKTVEIPVAVFIANLIGIPASVATGGIAVIGGAAGYMITKKIMRSRRKKNIYENIQSLCDKAENDVVEWAENVMRMCFNEENL
jgi:hypothetical protein